MTKGVCSMWIPLMFPWSTPTARENHTQQEGKDPHTRGHVHIEGYLCIHTTKIAVFFIVRIMLPTISGLRSF